MADQDPWQTAAARVQTSAPATAAPVASNNVVSNDPWMAAASRVTAQAPATLPSSSPSSNDPWAIAAGRLSPQSGQTQQDQNIFEKAWSWANTPLTQSVLGWNTSRQGATGFEKGAEEFLSGFTSPLSIALALGTFGTGSLLETGGAAALREAGMSAADIAEVDKGAQAVTQAVRTGHNIDAAIAASGADPEIVKKGLDYLHASGLSEKELLDKSLATSVGSKLFRGLGVPAAKATQIARKVQTLIGTGFTVQQAYGVVRDSGRILDLYSDASDAEDRGDTATAQQDITQAHELASQAVLGTLFAGFGASHAFHDAGIIAEDRAKLRPTENTRALEALANKRDENEVVGKRRAELFVQDRRKELGKTTAAQQLAMNNAIQAGFDPELLKARHDYIAQAIGSDKRLGSTFQEPIKPSGVADISHGMGLNTEQVPDTSSHVVWDPRYPDARVTVDEGTPKNEILSTLQTKLRERNVPEESIATVGSIRPQEGIPDNVDEVIRRGLLRDSKKYTPEEREALRQSYEDAINLSPEQTAVAKKVSNKLAEMFEFNKSKGTVRTAVENYLTNIWDLENNEAPPGVNEVMYNARSGRFDMSLREAMRRSFDSAFEGQLHGYKLAVTDPLAILQSYMGKSYEVAANRDFVDSIRDRGLVGDDGRPAVVLTGVSRYKVGKNGGNPADVYVDPNRIRSWRIDPAQVEILKKRGLLDQFLANGTIEEMDTGKDVAPVTTENGQVHYPLGIPSEEPVYKYTGEGYRDPEHPAFQNYFLASHTPEGQKTFVRGDYKFHPQFYDWMMTRMGLDKSVIRNNLLGKKLLEASTLAKGSILFGSPFHMVQEGLRAIMSGILPWGDDRRDPDTDPMFRLAVRNGLTGMARDTTDAREMQEGVVPSHNKYISKIPVVGAASDKYSDWLFNRYIPGLKYRAFKNLFESYKNAHPDWTEDRIAKEAASDANERFGGIPWQRLGRSASKQDLFRLTALAPDWLESELRFVKRLFTGDGSVARQHVGTFALGLWTVARIINYLNTGQGHYEAPFGLVFKDAEGRKKIYSMRTMPTDILHVASDPVGFMEGRVNPLVRSALEVRTGRDQFGRKLTPAGVFTDIARNLTPIPAQSIGRAMTNASQESTSTDQIVRALGGTSKVYKTSAQQMAAQLASNRSESGPLDETALRQHQAKMEIEDRVRAGQITLPQLHDMFSNGVITHDEQTQIVNDVKATQGLSPDMASLYLRANKLPMKDFLSVYDAATLEEKAALAKLLIKKKNAFFKNAGKNMTPAQRRSDPTYQRLSRMFPAGIVQ